LVNQKCCFLDRGAVAIRQRIDEKIAARDSGLVTRERSMAIFEDSERLEALCRLWKVKKLSLFGSRLKGTARPESDIDLLVEFEPGATPGLIAISQLELDLSELTGGAKVDLRTAEDLSRYFRDEVVRTAQLEYAA
jgi:predicted nucleotidyltransferase